MAKEAKDTTLLSRHIYAETATSAEPYLPEGRTLPVLHKAVQACRGCDLYRNATQAVFGEIEEKPRAGQHGVAVMMIGEQPGDKEDIEGRPFVGPATRPRWRLAVSRKQ